MPCMCGDPCCWSCGPAQGNSRCPICNEWVSEGCEHVDEETGAVKPEFKALAEESIRKENDQWHELAREYEQDTPF